MTDPTRQEIATAARATADYLYTIEGDCPDELYKAIATLRQLINEEFKPEKALSSQFIYDIIYPAIKQPEQIEQYALQKAKEELELLQHIDWESYHGEKKRYDDGTNELIDMYVESYVKDRIKELKNGGKDAT